MKETLKGETMIVGIVILGIALLLGFESYPQPLDMIAFITGLMMISGGFLISRK